jgi:hypothetical protein
VWLVEIRGSHFCRILNITSVVLGIDNVAKERGRGAPFPSSNCISYVTTRCASNILISFAAKNRPGLITNSETSCYGWQTVSRNAHHTRRPSPKIKLSSDVEMIWCLPVTASLSLSRSFENRNPSNSLAFSKSLSSVWVALIGMARSVPTGIVTPLENVNGRSTRRVVPTG